MEHRRDNYPSFLPSLPLPFCLFDSWIEDKAYTGVLEVEEEGGLSILVCIIEGGRWEGELKVSREVLVATWHEI